MSQEIKTIKLKPFSPTEDLEILEKWLNLPHVSQWWINPQNHWQAALNHPSHEHGIIKLLSIQMTYNRNRKKRKY